jgi:hypothetical protein
MSSLLNAEIVHFKQGEPLALLRNSTGGAPLRISRNKLKIKFHPATD